MLQNLPGHCNRSPSHQKTPKTSFMANLSSFWFASNSFWCLARMPTWPHLHPPSGILHHQLSTADVITSAWSTVATNNILSLRSIGENRQLVSNEPVELEKEPVEEVVQDCQGKLPIRFRGICRRIFPNFVRKTGGCRQHGSGWTCKH